MPMRATFRNRFCTFYVELHDKLFHRHIAEMLRTRYDVSQTRPMVLVVWDYFMKYAFLKQ